MRATRPRAWVAALLLGFGLLKAAKRSEELQLPAAKWHQDLAFLAGQLVKRHANTFHFISQQAFRREVDGLDARLSGLNSDEIFVGMDQIENSIGDGHTYIRIPRDAPLFPVEFERFRSDYRLTAAR